MNAKHEKAQQRVKSEPFCPDCSDQMKMIKNSKKADRYQYRCKPCGKAKSLRYDSIFSGSKLCLIELTRLIFHYFLDGCSIQEVHEKTKMDRKTISGIFIEMRGLLSHYIQATYAGVMMGGPYNDIDLDNPPVFEIDESLFSHVDGRQVWVFGIITRITNEARCWVVPDRSAQTLIPIIQQNIPLGSTIYNDGWRSYSSLTSLGYTHHVVVHEEGFGQGEHTTNHIEALWSELKRLTNYYSGIHGGKIEAFDRIQHHIDAGLWKRKIRQTRFSLFALNKVEELSEVINHFYI